MTAGERAIVSRLLEPTFPGRDSLRKQIGTAKVRTIDNDGSFSFHLADGPRAEVVRRIPVEAEIEDTDGVTVHVLLRIVDGVVRAIEIFREDGRVVRGPIAAENLRLILL
jgi:hypothetical protein